MPGLNFDWKHIVALGWPVLSVLLIFSMVALAVFLQSWVLLRRIRWAMAPEAGPQGFLVLPAYFELVDRRLALLGTIANASPFVGLLGTVVGIIRAFHSISTASGGGGIALVAGGISEALISTAAGLAVAIPASMVYNYFTYHSQRLSKLAKID